MAKKETKKPEKVKEKKGKNKKGAEASAPGSMPSAGATSTGVPPAGQASIPLSAMSPEQMTTAQLEQAIKESSDPESHLKKLRSPINVRSCLLNILFLIILTLGIVILWCFFAVDKFNFGHVMKDMLDKFKITEGFTWFWNWIKSWFS